MRALREVTLFLLSLSLAGGTQSVEAQEREREKISDTYKWDLTEIYPTAAAWKAAKEKFVAQPATVKKFRGMLAQSPAQLLQCLDLVFDLRKEYVRLYVYASLQSDLDTRDAENLGRLQEIRQAGSDFAAATAFVEPEVLAIGRAQVDGFLHQEPKLATYRHYLDDVLRRKAHTGTEGEEKIIADAGLMSDGP